MSPHDPAQHIQAEIEAARRRLKVLGWVFYSAFIALAVLVVFLVRS